MAGTSLPPRIPSFGEDVGSGGAIGGLAAYAVAWIFQLRGWRPDFGKVGVHGVGIGATIGALTWVGEKLFR